jgi:hypothetical protein
MLRVDKGQPLPLPRLLVFESPVQSGFLTFLAKTETETGPSNLPELEKPDRDCKRLQNRSFAVFCSLETCFNRFNRYIVV